jgi:YidC/Oxa1 family membrane protein insertase
MDNQRVFVWAALALVLWLNYTTWQRDYAPAPIAPAAAAPSSAANGSPAEDTLPALPSETSTPQQQQPATAPAPSGQPVETAVESKSGVVRITTDVLSMDISTRGGELVRADLLKYPLAKNRPDVPVRLFSPTPPVYVARSGLRAADNVPQPNHLATFRSEANEYRLKAGEAKLTVPLTWSEGGLTVTKTYARPAECRAKEHWDLVAEFSGRPWIDSSGAEPVASIRPELARIAQPVLLVNGEHDVEDFIRVADEIESSIADVQRVSVPGAGGFPLWEFPVQVNALVRQFFESPRVADA